MAVIQFSYNLFFFNGHNNLVLFDHFKTDFRHPAYPDEGSQKRFLGIVDLLTLTCSSVEKCHAWHKNENNKYVQHKQYLHCG